MAVSPKVTAPPHSQLLLNRIDLPLPHPCLQYVKRPASKSAPCLFIDARAGSRQESREHALLVGQP